MTRHAILLVFLLSRPSPVGGQDAGPAVPIPEGVHYTLRVDSADLSGWSVGMAVREVPDTFQLAMAAHPEYDDRYYRYVTSLAVAVNGRPAAITRVDSAVWMVAGTGGRATITYRVRLPEPERRPRAAWRPFLSPTGGLTGGYHTFMYVVGQERQPAGVTLDLPREWRVATALEGTADHRVFRAPDIHALVESPIFAGRFHDWAFSINRVLHRVVYWPAPGAASFDTTAFVAGIERLVRQAVALFGGPPYRDYTFIFQDAAYGGLEHPSSVTLGVTSQDLARDPHSSLEETAHEFFHTWNLMRIRPEEYQGVTWRTQPPTAGLWFSEGLTIYYADLLRRRAGLPLRDSSRQEHLESVLEQYLASPGNAVFSAESISKVEYNAGPGALGDYSASSHLVGEVLGTLLDIAIRQATQGARSMDDVMRLMLERHSGDRGFNGRDIEETVEEVCRCDVSPLFDRHVRGGGDAVDFDRYLAPLGWRAAVEWQPATWDNQPERDLRIWGWVPDGEDAVRLIVTNPESIWGRAGLHTLDRLVSINAVPVRSWPELRGALVRSRMGDTLVVEVMRDAGPFRATVMVAGFNRPSVRIVPVPGASAAQVRLREQWLAGS